LIELGYVPWYQNVISLPAPVRKTKLGLFLQSGYKFKVDTNKVSQTTQTGGASDESEEDRDGVLLRAKGSIGISPRFMFSKTFGLGIIGDADGWWDFVNALPYYRVAATFRLILSPDKSFDFTYQKGSGAPNFNKGDQFSANITVQY
jgi:hypothetical protein